MKKVFIYRKPKPKLWTLIKVKVFKILGYQIYIWGESYIREDSGISIKFPPSSFCSSYQKNARKMAAKYFDKNEVIFSGNIFRTDYVRKTIDISITDYYAFEKTIEEEFYSGDKIKIIAPSLFRAIFNDQKSNKNIWTIIYYPFWTLRLSVIFFRDYLLCLLSKNKIKAPSIIYIRKKVYPDMGEYASLSKKLNKENRNILGIYPFTGRKDQKFGYYYISSIEGMALRFFKVFLSTLNCMFKDLNFFIKNGIDHYIYRQYIFDIYRAKSILSLNPKVLCGQLLDKPIYILLPKYKSNHTEIVSFNESFRYPPNRAFDFVHLDKYYSMNNIDEKMQNIYGGEIRSFHQVEFFREGVPSELSRDFLDAIESFDYSIVLATGQIYVEKGGYNFWAYDEVEKFLRITLGLSQDFKNTLFIVKGKKGELKALPEWFDQIVKTSNNIFVIHSDKPRDLKYNNFEAVMDRADLLISSAHISTTIWQAILREKAVIAVNDIHPPSVLRDFKGYECNLLELKDTIQYWMSLSDIEIKKKNAGMKKIFNLGSNKGLKQIADDLIYLVRESS
tara:strand:+ start:13437 stop:15119 length:1683 start_codon:yes stop_codon:yes gene_type:complete